MSCLIKDKREREHFATPRLQMFTVQVMLLYYEHHYTSMVLEQADECEVYSIDQFNSSTVYESVTKMLEVLQTESS